MSGDSTNTKDKVRTRPVSGILLNSKGLTAAGMVMLMCMLAVSAATLWSGETDAEYETDADTVSELSDEMTGASSDMRIRLTGGFADDLRANGNIHILIGHGHNITITSDAPLAAPAGGLHFNIANSGSGTVRFEGIAFENSIKAADTGGINLHGGSYGFEDCRSRTLPEQR